MHLLSVVLNLNCTQPTAPPGRCHVPLKLVILKNPSGKSEIDKGEDPVAPLGKGLQETKGNWELGKDRQIQTQEKNAHTK